MQMTAERGSVAVSEGPVPVRAVLALAHREGIRLLRHPLTIAFGVTTVLGLTFTEGELTNLRASTGLLGFMLFPICAGALLAANHAALRSRRDGVDEVVECLPLDERARTNAHLLSAVYAAGLGLLLIGAWIAYHRAMGAVGWPDIGDLLIAPVLLAGATAIGVLMARWIPSALGGVLGIILVGVVEVVIMNLEPQERMAHWIAPWPGWGTSPMGFWPRPTVLHAVYLCALIAVIVVIALLRSGASARLLIAGVTASSVALTTGSLVARSPSVDQLSAIARRIEAGGDHCVARRYARYCTYAEFADLAAVWAEAVEPVLARVPGTVRSRGLVVRQRFVGSRFDDLPPTVREQLDPALWTRPFRYPDDGALSPGFGWSVGLGDLLLGLDAAAWAVGLPLAPSHKRATKADLPTGDPREIPQDILERRVGDIIEYRCAARGQARAVVALWLATQGNDHAARALRAAYNDDDPDDGVTAALPGEKPFEGPPAIAGDALVTFEPPTWLSDASSPITWGLSDIRYAQQLLERPAAEVAGAIATQWRTLTHPDTTTTALVQILNLAPLSSEQLDLPPGALEPSCT